MTAKERIDFYGSEYDREGFDYGRDNHIGFRIVDALHHRFITQSKYDECMKLLGKSNCRCKNKN